MKSPEEAIAEHDARIKKAQGLLRVALSASPDGLSLTDL